MYKHKPTQFKFQYRVAITRKNALLLSHCARSRTPNKADFSRPSPGGGSYFKKEGKSAKRKEEDGDGLRDHVASSWIDYPPSPSPQQPHPLNDPFDVFGRQAKNSLKTASTYPGKNWDPLAVNPKNPPPPIFGFLAILEKCAEPPNLTLPSQGVGKRKHNEEQDFCGKKLIFSRFWRRK